MRGSPDAQAIVVAIVRLGESLAMPITAEGVEDEAEDEEDEVPSPQSPGQPLAPHPDGVAEQSGGDERAGERIHWDLPA